MEMGACLYKGVISPLRVERSIYIQALLRERIGQFLFTDGILKSESFSC